MFDTIGTNHLDSITGSDMRAKLTSLFSLLSLAVLPACFQMEYVIALEDDLSGTAEMTILMDLEQMAVSIASIQGSFTGDTTPPSEARVEEVRAMLRAEMGRQNEDPERWRRQMASEVPPGVEVLDVERAETDSTTRFQFRVRFADLRALTALDLQQGDQEMPGNTRPFGDLEVVEEDGTLIIRTPPMNPVADMQSEMGMMITEAMMAAMFRDMESRISIEAPFPVIEHNATEQSGNRLTWVLTYETLSSGATEQIYVRYRR